MGYRTRGSGTVGTLDLVADTDGDPDDEIGGHDDGDADDGVDDALTGYLGLVSVAGRGDVLDTGPDQIDYCKYTSYEGDDSDCGTGDSGNTSDQPPGNAR